MRLERLLKNILKIGAVATIATISYWGYSTAEERVKCSEPDDAVEVTPTDLAENPEKYDDKCVRLIAKPHKVDLQENVEVQHGTGKKIKSWFQIILEDDEYFANCMVPENHYDKFKKICREAYQAVGEEIEDGDNELITIQGTYTTPDFPQGVFPTMIKVGDLEFRFILEK